MLNIECLTNKNYSFVTRIVHKRADRHKYGQWECNIKKMR